MTSVTVTTIAVRTGPRPASQASGRLRRAAEHYVKNGCKSLAKSLVWAGYSETTAKDPTRNGYGHDRLVEIAAHWNKGAQATAKSHLASALSVMTGIMNNDSAGPAARGSAAKVIIDYAGKEVDKEDTSEATIEEQARWMNQIKHWKRTFLRRGLLLGMEAMSQGMGQGVEAREDSRGWRLLAELNWVLGKGPQPEWANCGGGNG